MAEQVKVEEVADAMYKMIKDSMGQKKWKATDLTKAVIELFGADKCDKKLAKLAIRELVESERCVYTYFGGSFIEIPHKEGAAN
jgi:hypothetical protein